MKSACVLLFLIGTLVVRGANAQLPSCIGQVNGYTFNNPVSDNEYFICLNNVAIPIQCPVGYLFCAGATYCTTSCAPVVTAPTPTTVTTKAPTTVTTKAPTTVTTKAPTTVTTKAPTTVTTKAPTTVTTKAPTTVTTKAPTTPATTVCTGQIDGTIFPNPTSCTSYLLCTNGVPVSGTCLAPYSFDAATGSCVNKPCKN